MANEDTDTFTSCKVPHANSLVDAIAGGEDVCAIGVPSDLHNGRVVTDEQTKWGDVILSPDSSCLVPTTGSEVMTKRAPAKVPDGTLMTLVDDEAGPSLERPESDMAIR